MSEIESLLRTAAREWVDLYIEEDTDSRVHPSNDEPFIWLARDIYRKELERRGLGDGIDPRRPLGAVCNDFPNDGEPILYMHMGNDGDILYIGKTRQTRKRQQMHRQNSYWWNRVCYLEFEKYPDETSLGLAEVAAIKKYRPKYNRSHNGGRVNA